MTVLFTQGVVIYDPKYYESKGPFSYTLHDWLGDMFTFFLTASPFILGTIAVVFGLYWWSNRTEADSRIQPVMSAMRAAFISLVFITTIIFIGEVVVYNQANEKIARLNKVGPPK